MIWNNGNQLLQYAASYDDQDLAKQKAKELKGLVKCGEQIWFDFRR